MHADLIVHRPTAAATQLILLFHGVGASADSLRPLGEALAAPFPQACIVSVQAPDPSDFGSGWQWFSVQGITEANRPGRVVVAMPRFVQTVQRWQQDTGVGPATTVLVGFSQGAIMALESTQQTTPLAARVVAVAGRFAQAPHLAPAQTQVHLMHGEADPVIAVGQSAQAEALLRALGASVTLDRFAGLGHGIDARVAARIAERLGK